MEERRTQLAAGVELLTVCTNQFKTGLFTVNLAVPLRRESATANALIPDVLYRGSKKNPDIASLSAATDYLYGAALEVGVRQRGESQCICLECSFIDDIYSLDGTEILEPVIDLVGEVLLDPVLENGMFSSHYVSSEGENLADRIESKMNDKTDWAVFRLLSEMCKGEAFALDKLGNAEEARRMTAEELWVHYQKLLTEARVVFYYNGSASHERVEKAVRRAFYPLLTDRCASYCCEVRPAPVGPVQKVTDVLDVTQGKLAMGFRTGGITMEDQRYPALLVCNILFGGSGSSKLFTNVREKKGLCYFISSVVDKMKGVMVVISGVDADDFEIAEAEILLQLKAIQAEEFTAGELAAAILAVSSKLAGQKDSQGQMEDYAVSKMIAQSEISDLNRLISAVKQVTAQEVAAVARQIQLDTVYRLTGREEA